MTALAEAPVAGEARPKLSFKVGNYSPQGDPPPEDYYQLRFTGYDVLDNKFGKQSIRLNFSVDEGEHKGKTADALVNLPQILNDKTTLKPFAEALVGRPLEDGEGFVLDDHIGTVRRGSIVHNVRAEGRVYANVERLSLPTGAKKAGSKF